MLERILENFPGKTTAHSVIQAIRAYSCLTDDNRWVELPTRLEYTITANRAQNPAPELESVSPPKSSHAVLDVPANSAPAAAAAPNPPPNWPNWNGRFAVTKGPWDRIGLRGNPACVSPGVTPGSMAFSTGKGVPRLRTLGLLQGLQALKPDATRLQIANRD